LGCGCVPRIKLFKTKYDHEGPFHILLQGKPELGILNNNWMPTNFPIVNKEDKIRLNKINKIIKNMKARVKTLLSNNILKSNMFITDNINKSLNDNPLAKLSNKVIELLNKYIIFGNDNITVYDITKYINKYFKYFKYININNSKAILYQYHYWSNKWFIL
jgi:hypothetical protein